MRIHLVNPSHVSFGVGVITPRWLYVLAAATPRSAGDPVLTDVEHLKQYSVLREDSVRWRTDEVSTDTLEGKAVVGTYYFAAPQDDIDRIDVQPTEFWPAFTDVPLSR